jgi:hypothetical protein
MTRSGCKKYRSEGDKIPKIRRRDSLINPDSEIPVAARRVARKVVRLKPVAVRSVDRSAVNEKPVSWRSFDRGDCCTSSLELTLDEEDMDVGACMILRLKDGYRTLFERGNGVRRRDGTAVDAESDSGNAFFTFAAGQNAIPL